MVEQKTTKWAYFAIGSLTALGLILIFSFSFFSSVAHAAGGGTFAWTSPTEIKATQMDSTVNGGSKVDVTFTCHKTITASQYVCQDLGKKTGICPTDITITGDGGSGKLNYYASKSACDPGSIGEFTISIDNKSAAPTDVGGTGAVPAPVTTDASGTVIDPNANAGAAGADPQLECHIISLNPLNYFMCPLVKGLNATINGLDHAINDMLTVDQKKIFDTSCADTCNTARAYYEAWKTFRIFALSILFAGGLFMIISQALGFSFLDAYTIKKIVPRLLVAIIGIALSWQIMGFFVTLTNDLGYGVRQIIYYPFRNFPGSLQLGGGTELLLAIIGGAAIGAFTIVGLLSFVVTAAMAIAVAFLILVIRQLVVVVLILFAPIAIACYILPNTQSIWKLWYESFTKAMLMFPIIVAFLAVGRIFAVTAIGGSIATVSAASQLLGFVAYVAPYFLIPFAFKFAGGALATLSGSMNNRSRGGFDRLKKLRQGKVTKSLHDMGQGTRFNNRGLNALTSRATTASAGFGKRGRAAYSQKMDLASGEHAKTDGMKIQHNDDALRAATYGSASQARAEMKNDWRKADNSTYSDEEIDTSIAAVKASGGFGRARQVYAAQQLSATGTGYSEGAIDQVAKTIARVSHGNESQIASLAGNINSGTKSSGRHDLAPGYANLNRLSRQEAGIEAGVKDYGSAAEGAWNSGGLYQHANDKKANIDAAINHFTPLLSSTDGAQRQKAAVFFNEMRSMQPNASGDVKNSIQTALESNRTSLGALFQSGSPTELPNSPVGIADNSTGQQVVQKYDGTTGDYTRTITPPTGSVPESAKQRVERLSRTYERPDQNNL